MSGILEIPEGITIPGWLRRYLENRATTAGPANPPPPLRVDNFAKICKDFRAMGGKPFHGSETFVEARKWLKEVEELFGIFEVEDGRMVQLAAWLMKDEASFWWEVTNGEHPVETWPDFRRRFEAKFLSRAEEN